MSWSRAALVAGREERIQEVRAHRWTSYAAILKRELCLIRAELRRRGKPRSPVDGFEAV